MFFNKKSFGSVLFLAVLQTSNVILVDASPFTKGNKKQKSNQQRSNQPKTEKCPSSGKKTSKGERILAKYNEFPTFSFTSGGIYTALDPPIDQRLITTKTFFDASCPETTKLICLKDCDTNPDCTAVEAIFYFKGNFSICSLYNGDIQDAPIFKISAKSEDLNISILSTVFTLKDKPPIPPFEASFLVPPDETDAFPEGSPDFIKYVLPGTVCVGTNGFTTDFDLALSDDCNSCIRTSLNNKNCDPAIRAICNGELAEACTDRCGPPACTALVQQAVLAFNGQAYEGIPDRGDGQASALYGCIARDVFDSKLNDFLPPYTCPNNFIRPSVLP